MRRSLVRFVLLGSLLTFGCAKPITEGATGTGDSSGNGGSGGDGQTSGSGGSQTSGNGGSSQATGTGGSSPSSTGGSTGTACTPTPTQLVNAAGWNCDV